MSAPRCIQLDLAFTYQKAAISAVRGALRQTHGADFAAAFVREHRHAILVAALWHVIGHSKRPIDGEATGLGSVNERF